MQELRTYQGNDNLEKYGNKVPKTEVIDQKFYNYVMQDVNDDATGINLSLQIYNSLNKKVSYDEIFFAFGNDYNFQKNKSCESITKDNNIVICDIWANLFALFLENNDISAVVNKEAEHSKVYFCVDGHIICADATQSINSPQENMAFTDITRCKLGLIPNNFLIYEEDEKGIIVERNLLESQLIKKSNINIEQSTFSIYISKLINLLKNNKTYKKYNNLSKDNILETFEKIKRLLSNSKLDTLSNITYINNLIKVLLTIEDQQKIQKDYIKIQQEGEVVLGLLLNYCPYEVEFPRYCDFHPSVNGINFLFTNKKGLYEISEDEAYNLQEKNDEIELNFEQYIPSSKGEKR